MFFVELFAYLIVLLTGADLVAVPQEEDRGSARLSGRTFTWAAVGVGVVSMIFYFILGRFSASKGLFPLRNFAAVPLIGFAVGWLWHRMRLLQRESGRFTDQVAGIFLGANIVPGRYGGSADHMYVLYEPVFQYFYGDSVYCTPSRELYGRDALMRLFTTGREYPLWVDPAVSWDYICSPTRHRVESCRKVLLVYLIVAIVLLLVPA